MKFLIAAVAGVLCVASSVSGAMTLTGAPKPVFLYGGPKDDTGWNQAVDLARTNLEAKLHMTIPYAEVGTEGDVTTAAENYISHGDNVVIGDSEKYSAPFKGLSEKYPHVAFINIADDIVSAPQLANLRSVYGRSYESQFLCGVVAGKTSKTGNIGFLALRPSPIANWEINGYTLGVRVAHPDATVHVLFTGHADPAKERQGALALIDRGADVLGQSLDGATPQIAAQERGVFATGHAVDLHEQAPKSTLCTSVWVWDRYLSLEIARIAAGTWQAETNNLLGITKGGTDIACCNTAVKHDTFTKLLDERDGIIISGKHVFSGPLVDSDNKERVPAGGVLDDVQLWKMDWYVKGVVIDR
jgi:basic membrane protein A and related proteins